MNKNSTIRLAAAAALLACASFARAQEPSSKAADAKAAEVVRERRATETQKSAPPSNVKAAAETAKASEASETQGASADASLSPAKSARERQAAAERLAESGNKTEAVALLRSMLAEERFDPPFFYNTGNALARLGESEAAVEAYRKAVAQRRGNYARAQHNLGVVLTRMGRWEEAEEALSSALKLESYNYAEASYSLGRLHALRGETALASAEWARTLRLKPDHTDAAVSLARLLSEGGDTVQALAVLDALSERLGRRGSDAPREITVARGEIVAAANLAAEEAHARDRDDVRPEEKRVAMTGAGVEKVVSNTKPSSNTKSSSNTMPPSDADASAVLRNARASSAKPLVATGAALDLLRRARAAREGGAEEEALALYRRAVQTNGGYFAPANLELAYTLASLRRNEEAAASVLSVIRRDGTRYPIAFYHVGRFYEHLNRLPEAEAAYMRAAELLGDRSPQFYIDLSRVRERRGDYAGALWAAEAYVREAAHAGSVPEWAHARVRQLKQKSAQAAEQPKAEARP